ncbi:hypothetical protein [Flavobacterium sp.]|uniref:hypothetical protein n=1 Tax=Flavobacterium sp. TaxID=239 RepID=UPI0037531289
MFTGKIELFDINNILTEHANYLNGIEISKKIVLGPWHIWFHNGTVDVNYVESDEESSGEGSSGSDNSDSSETGNDGNNNSNGNTGSGNGSVVIPNVPCVNCPAQGSNANEIPCESLTNKSNETVFRQKFKDLNGSSRFNANGETAYFETRDINNNPKYTFKSAYDGTHQITISNGTISFMHVHNNTNEDETEEGIRYNIPVKMISPADINTFISTCQNNANNAGVDNTDTYGIMISSEGIFAIKMLENDTFNPEIDNVNLMNIKYSKKAKEIFNANPSGSTVDKSLRKEKLQKLLLSLMKEFGVENKVGLFEGEVTSPEPGQPNLPVINWTRKTLNNNGELLENPC